MKKKLLLTTGLLAILGGGYFLTLEDKQTVTPSKFPVEKKKKTLEERALFSEERLKHEFNMQVNPLTGEIPQEEKQQELINALKAKQIALANKNQTATYISRGPSNLGGRTRAFAIDISDGTGNTMLAGGVSSGLFRTTNGGTTWTKVSPNDEIHNVTAVVQDPRSGHQNTWYYATGERSGNSASLGSFYFGQGIWKSTNSGVTWTQISQTNSTFESFDSSFDLISNLKVSPLNGDLIIAAYNKIYRFDGTTMTLEVDGGSTQGNGLTDVAITSTGVVYAAFHGSETENGVYTSPTGNGSWTRIAQNGTPTNWSAGGRIVLGVAPSNADIVYVMYMNGASFPNIDADLWQYNAGTTTWTDYSSKLPDEPGGNLEGTDPFTGQGGYDLVVAVKPDDANFVVIGGTNVYKIADITNDATFERIGGYINRSSYGLYAHGGDTHHPDIHTLVFSPTATTTLFSGTDGGVHKTTDVTVTDNDITTHEVQWTNLNNDYLTYQYYHVALDPKTGSDMVLGGAQDNGTTIGGTDATGWPGVSNTAMYSPLGADGVATSIARRNSGADYQLYMGWQNGTMYYWHSDTGWSSKITPTGSSSQFVTYWYLDPDNNDHLYYAAEDDLYRTTSAETITAGTWDKISGGLPSLQNIKSMATSRGAYNASSSYLLLGGDEGGIVRYDDPANAGSLTVFGKNITPSGATTAAGTIVSGLAVHPTNPDIVLATYANYGINNIYITSNATSTTPTWTLVERNLSSHSVRSAAIVEVGGKTIYMVGTARGLYASDDPTTQDWTLQSPNKIGLAVISSLVYRPADQKLLIGTHGNGMFETTVTSTLSTTSVSKNDLNAIVYPNPVVNELNVISDKVSNDAKFVISDLSGKQIRKGKLVNNKVDVRSLKAGIYLLNIEAQGLKQSMKFIKN